MIEMTELPNEKFWEQIEEYAVMKVAQIRCEGFLLAVNKTPKFAPDSEFFDCDIVIGKVRNAFRFFERAGEFRYEKGSRLFESLNYKQEDIRQIHIRTTNIGLAELKKLLMRKVQFEGVSCVFERNDTINFCRDEEFLKLAFSSGEVAKILDLCRQNDSDFDSTTCCHWSIFSKFERI